MEREINYSTALREATESEMSKDKSVIVLGMGVDDPLGIYGTTSGYKISLALTESSTLLSQKML